MRSGSRCPYTVKALLVCATLIAHSWAGELRYLSGKRSQSIPFRLDEGHIYIQVRINGSRPLSFLLDSGASHNLIDTRIARELGLNVQFIDREDRAIGAQHPAAYLVTSEVVFRFPGVDLRDDVAVAMSLDQTSACLGGGFRQKPEKSGAQRSVTPPQSDMKLAGIVGRPPFEAGLVEIDYRRRVLRLYSSGEYKYPRGAVTLPIEADSDLFFLQTSVKSKGHPPATARLVIDTGAETALSLSKQFAERNGMMPRASELIPGKECGAAGSATEPTLIGELEALRFGPLEVLNPATVFYEQTERRNYDGLLGNRAFRGFRVIIDLSQHRFTLESSR